VTNRSTRYGHETESWAFCPRRDISKSGDGLETEMTRPRLHPCYWPAQHLHYRVQICLDSSISQLSTYRLHLSKSVMSKACHTVTGKCLCGA